MLLVLSVFRLLSYIGFIKKDGGGTMKKIGCIFFYI